MFFTTSRCTTKTSIVREDARRSGGGDYQGPLSFPARRPPKLSHHLQLFGSGAPHALRAEKRRRFSRKNLKYLRMYGALPAISNCAMKHCLPTAGTGCTRKPILVCRMWSRCCGMLRVPFVAVTDFMKTIPDLIRPWVMRRYVTLGTDGYGRSDTREALRRFFEVDAESIASCRAARSRAGRFDSNE